MPLAAFALFLALPLWAQHGGGHAGGGHGGGSGGHAGFGGGHIGGGGGHVFGGVHSGGMRSSPGVPRAFSHAPSFSRRGYSSPRFLHGRFHGRHIRTHGFRTNCYGYGCRGDYFYPYAYGGYYDPYWWWDSGSSYDEDYERDRSIANQMNAQSLAEQRMRQQEEADGDQDLYSRSAPPVGDQEENAPIVPAMVLVFRDQHKQEVRNYAIVGQTLWSFAAQRNEKIPLADLDLAATIKANDDRGLTFRLPASNEAQ